MDVERAGGWFRPGSGGQGAGGDTGDLPGRGLARRWDRPRTGPDVDGVCQEGAGRARSLSRARLKRSAQGQRCGRCRVRRRAERVSRPTRENRRRLRVFVFITRTPRPMREVQRARLCAITCTAIQAALAENCPEGMMVESHTVLEVSYGVLHLGVATMVRLQFQGVSLSVGDEGVVAVVGDKGQLGAWGGFHPTHDQPHGHGVGFARKGRVGGFGHICGPVHPVGYGSPGILGYLLYEIAQMPVLSDGDGEADIVVAAHTLTMWRL